jgi:pyridinium-3,5-biscarboxylic acid mononucleotide synthase
MTRETIFELLKDIQQGGISPENALRRLADMPFEDAEFAKIDHHRIHSPFLPVNPV